MIIFTELGAQATYGEVPENAEPTGFGAERWYHDKNGNVRHSPPRTKISHPYSYDAIVLFDDGETSTASAYSDRMAQWDYDKFHKFLGMGEMRFTWGSQECVQAFARGYFDDETLILNKVVEMCNVATGYPVWLLFWNSNKTVTV